MNKLFTIAYFESRTLLRSWFFRIFAAITIIIIFLLDLLGFTNVGQIPWRGRLVAGCIPYINLFLLNLFQSVIAVFISIDFLGRDKKLDTTGAFYARSVSNFGYVTGKTLGVGLIFLFLNIIVLSIGAVFNIIATDVDFFPLTYLIYPLLISLPTIIFVVGLSFFLMVLIRNQAVTFILMLGLLGAGLFYLSGKWYNVFDFTGFSTPMAYSVFAGLPDFGSLVMIRLSYVLLGLSFIFFTVLMLPRLPQERAFRLRVILGIGLTFLPAVILVTTYLMNHKSDEDLRISILKLDETLPDKASCTISTNHISLVHKGRNLGLKSVMEVIPDNNDKISFVLNPGFKIEDVILNEINVKYERNLHLVTIENEEIIKEKQPLKVEISYRGTPENAASFIEIPEDIRTVRNRLDLLVAGKKVAFVQPSYVLLTREAAWYPVAACRNFRNQPQFTRFKLEARVSPSLTVFSQGEKDICADGSVIFRPGKPLNALSFVAGSYTTKSVKLDDSLTVSLAVYSENLQHLDYFNDISDTIPSLIKEMKADYERKMGYNYPFKQFCLLEVPVHFFTYPRNWTLATEDNMPEYVFVAERGVGGLQTDLQRQSEWIERQNERQGENLLPREIQARLFRNVIGNVLLESRGGFRFRETELRNLEGWSKHLIFPQYFSYTNGIREQGFPILQFITENHFFSRVQSSNGGFRGPNISTSDQIVLKMEGKSFDQLVDSLKYDPSLSDMLSKKGDQFFSILETNITSRDIDLLLDTIIMHNRFGILPSDTLINKLNTFSALDVASFFEKWKNNSQTPAFFFGNTEAFEVKEGNYTRYFVRCRLKNEGKGDGVLSVGIREHMRERLGRRGGGPGGGPGGGFPPGMPGGMGGPTIEKTYIIPSGESVEIGMMTDTEPRELIIDTYVSQNLPLSQRLVVDDISKKNVEPFEGMRIYDGIISLSDPGEIIVDNEDSDFTTISNKESSTVKNWWMSQISEEITDKYQNINRWRPSSQWQAVLGTEYFGKYIKSAVYKQKGTGDATSQWTAHLPESGNYEVYAYIPRMMRRPGFGGPRGRSEQNERTGSFLYSITHDDGETQVEINTQDNQGGWIFLGDFYMSEGNSKVTLSDKTSNDIVIADAIKWVKN
jgi:hypothetical protein